MSEMFHRDAIGVRVSRLTFSPTPMASGLDIPSSERSSKVVKRATKVDMQSNKVDMQSNKVEV